MAYEPERDPMDLDTAVAVLRGTVPWPITAADMEKATVIVLAELERRGEIEQRARTMTGVGSVAADTARYILTGEGGR